MTKPNEKLVEFPTTIGARHLDRRAARRRAADVGDGDRGRGRRLPRGSSDHCGRGGPTIRRPQWSSAPPGDFKRHSGTCRCSRRGFGTAGPPMSRRTFRSAILPPYLRKTPSLEALYPWLYLKGISTGDFGDALQALLGSDARGLSATTITRLKAVWEQEYQDWSKRSLAHRRLCLRLGRRRVLQRSARGHGQQTAVHSGGWAKWNRCRGIVVLVRLRKNDALRDPVRSLGSPSWRILRS